MKLHKIMEYESKLEATDYIDNKLFEAFISGNTKELESLKHKYADILEDRKLWREEIRKLESEVQDVSL